VDRIALLRAYTIRGADREDRDGDGRKARGRFLPWNHVAAPNRMKLAAASLIVLAPRTMANSARAREVAAWSDGSLHPGMARPSGRGMMF
jgi:hypothetical protein